MLSLAEYNFNTMATESATQPRVAHLLRVMDAAGSVALERNVLLVKETVDEISRLTGKIKVVIVVGSARSGKSTLSNHVSISHKYSLMFC
jgi:polynucleotide 5'-kinase involved in rRNA processing